MADTQNYQNHIRFHPIFHFVFAPLALIHLIYAAVRLYQEPSYDRLFYVVLAISVVAAMTFARLNALKIQDRIVRLEEDVRYRRILPPELAMQAARLTDAQIIALRFASDAELPDLVTRTLNNEFARTGDIKKAVKNWRGDYLRV